MKKTIIILVSILVLALVATGCVAQGNEQGASVNLKNPEASNMERNADPEAKQVTVTISPNSVTEPAPDPVPAPEGGSQAGSTAANIGLEAAKKIALAHVGLTENDVVFTKAKEDLDDGKVVYDIEFYANEVEYDFEIAADSGMIREFDYDLADGGTAPSINDYIGLDAAKKIALAHANLSASQVTFTKAKQDTDDGRVVYELEFFAGNIEYDYEIDAVTGAIIEYDHDVENGSTVPAPTTAPGTSTYIGLDAAKKIALAHANLTASQVTFTKAKQDTDDGRVVYELEFFAGNIEYDYEIDAITGNILDYDHEVDDDLNAPAPTTAPSTTTYIGLDAAKKIALAHANLTASQVTFTKAKQDTDDGRVVYELEFFAGNIEYDYEIDAITGNILDYDHEVDDDLNAPAPTTAPSTTDYIGLDAAKKIALAHANLTASQVTFTKANQDTDDGRVVYEIEFLIGNVEYDYEIDAITGNILDYDSEVEDD